MLELPAEFPEELASMAEAGMEPETRMHSKRKFRYG